jgi:EAL and modified HD-GYP domain-containing signal transduction protein
MHQGDSLSEISDFRQFFLQPIVGPNRQGFGSEALYRAGWEETSREDPSATSRLMLDNWLLYGFDELIGERTVFLKCARETLMSGLLSLLPHSAVFEIAESIRPDDEVLAVCRSLKAAGYRFALDDFKSPETMEEFLELADFIKVDFRHSGRRKRACMLRRLNLTGATLIAEEIESEEEFQQAVEEGFGLFQGHYFGERTTFVKKRDALDAIHCTRILEALQGPDFPVDELTELINQESGIECRLLRRANWVTPPSVAVNSIREALDLVEMADVRKLVMLAMTAASQRGAKSRPVSRPRISMRPSADVLVRWSDGGARTPWWYGASQGSAL